jgi:hypothetical protein
MKYAMQQETIKFMATHEDIRDSMQRLGVTAEFLGGLCAAYGVRGVDQPAISKALRGVRPLSDHQINLLAELLDKLKARLFDALEPAGIVPLLREPAKVRRLLDDLEAQRTVLVAVSGINPSE